MANEPKKMKSEPKDKRFGLYEYEKPLGPGEIRRVLDVFHTLLWTGPRARSLPPLLKDLTEEQLAQIRIAAFRLYSSADDMIEEKSRARKIRAVLDGRRKKKHDEQAADSLAS